jgi:hypothetical protein
MYIRTLLVHSYSISLSFYIWPNSPSSASLTTEICGNAFSPRRHIQGIEATQTFTAKRLEHGNAYRGPAVILVSLDRERAIDVQFPVVRWVRLPSPFPRQCCHVCQQRYTKSCCHIGWAQAVVAADYSVSEVHEYGEPMFMLRAVSGDE